MFRACTVLCVFAAMLVGGSRIFTDAAGPGERDKDKKQGGPALKFAPKDAFIVFGIGGKSKLTRLEDAEAVEKLLGDKGKADAKALAAQVDFKKAAIVLVSWTTSGPPDGVLKHEVKDK